MELAILLTIVVLIFTSAFFIMGSIVEEKRAKKYKETVKQVVDMLVLTIENLLIIQK